MQNEAVKKSAEQVTVSNANNEVMKKAFANVVQGVANLTAVVATEAIRTVANVTIFGIAKTAELVNKIFDDPRDAKQKSEFISKFNSAPDKFWEIIKDGKEILRQKLIKIKKTIKRIYLKLDEAKGNCNSLSDEINDLNEKLKKVRDKIKELKNQPGQKKNVEILKMREKEILNKLEELNRRRLEELNRIKELEEQKEKLEAEKNLIEKDIKAINSFEDEFKQTLDEKNLAERYRENISKKYEKMREENPTEVSQGHLDFKAFIDTNTYNMQNLTSTKFSMRQEVEKPSWIEERLQRANDNGFKVSSPSEQNHEHGGKDNMER